MFEVIVFLILLLLGYVFGRIAEARHFKSIRLRERQYASILAFSARFPPPQTQPVNTALVAGNVVVSIDYFKLIAASLRNLVGGRVTAYESLLERARREAILRMKADAVSKGGKQIFNVKLETSSISQGTKQQVGAVEIYAYGTALIPLRNG